MRRTLVSLAALLILATAAVGFAQETEGEDKLQLNRVVMFSSGVSFFQHAGQVEGNASVDLKFKVEDINDLLKSMVLQDLGGGRVSTVTYGSRDPITKTLKTFAIDLTSNPSLAQILSQVRGERVEVEAPNKITGVILGVQTKKKRVEDEVVQVELLNLLTPDGLRSIELEMVSQIKLLNEKLDAELRQALQVLALGHDSDKKTVKLNFLGNGQRQVRVGYVQESPIWKTSYRLVLKDNEQPFLQGWAIVENSTDHDWKDVSLTLVSGRPISFIMDLYRPLYVDRPVVQMELYASLRPQTYDQDLETAAAEFADLAKAPAQTRARRELKRAEKRLQDGRGYAGRPANGIAALEEMDLAQGVKAMAQAGDVGEMFQYAIENPVTLPRQQSAMLPIVNNSVKGEKVSIYNPAVQQKHPLNGLQLANTSGLHLMQGPVTVFDGGVYAGDAKLPDLSPGATRLISYALDLDTEVAVEQKSKPNELTKVRIIKGVLEATRKYERAKKYIVKNSGKEAKKVLVEQPIDHNWKLIVPENPAEKTRDLYRFAVQAQPGKPQTLAVEEERVIANTYALTNLSDNDIRLYIRADVVSKEIKEALAEVIKRKQAISEVVAERNGLQAKLNAIAKDQSRIRENMKQLSRTSDLYTRYVKKFTAQEDEIEQLRTQISALNEKEDSLRKSLDDYLRGLTL